MWLYQALEAEEHALQHGTQAQLPPYPGLLQQLGRATWAAWRELLTRLTRSELKHWINHSASSRAAWKLLKDPRCVRLPEAWTEAGVRACARARAARCDAV
jgi:hypothetical protein